MFKKLVPALIMLLISAILMATSTYAWFSMNTTVTAENMEITATSNNPYLVISETENGTYDTDASSMILTPAASSALQLVTPLNVASNVQYYADTSARSTDTKTTPTKFTNAASVLWGTANSSDPAQVQAANTPILVAGADLADYVQSSNLWFKILPGNVDGENLTCTKVSFSAGTNSIAASGRVLLVSETGKFQLFKLVNGDVTTAETGSDAALLATVTTTPQQLTVYFYFDGTDSSAYTNNATDLSGVTAEFEFQID